VAVRKDLLQKSSSSGVKYANSKDVPYHVVGTSEDVFIHPTSVLANAPPPDYLVFFEIMRSSRVWIKGDAGYISTLLRADYSPKV
jgi:ATP-dependent RNA helicase DHX37/DHR1